jgi:hypothetical protein
VYGFVCLRTACISNPAEYLYSRSRSSNTVAHAFRAATRPFKSIFSENGLLTDCPKRNPKSLINGPLLFGIGDAFKGYLVPLIFFDALWKFAYKLAAQRDKVMLEDRRYI